jgi:hypothetical protein
VPSRPKRSTTGVSNVSRPLSISCNVEIAVKSLVIDAVSKRVSRLLGMRQARLA